VGEPLVEIHDLTKTYEPSPLWLRFLLRSAIDQPVHALNGVTLSVHPGEVCAIVGPNGAGKSTLFRILTGLTTPTTGSAAVLGRDVQTESRRVRRQVGFMPADDRSLFLRHTCWQNLAFHGHLQGVPKSELPGRISDVLEMVGLGHAATRAGFALSSGMRARLQLARALLHRPKVLILDEPTGTVDPIGAHQLLNLIEELTHELGLAVLLSSHRLEEIDALRDNVAFLDRGHLVHWGDLATLRRLWEQPRLLIRFKTDAGAADAADRLSCKRGMEVERAEDNALMVTTGASAGEVLSALGSRLDELVFVEEDKMPLRELLSKLVETGTGGRPPADESGMEP
jgi:ABC-2 type transport system ATP-binding protein